MLYTKTILAILIVSFLGFIFLNSPHPIRVEGDGVFYFSWLRSVVFDGDFDFLNELEHFSSYDFYSQKILLSDFRTPLDKISNPYAYGTAILWLPLYLVAYIFSIVFFHTTFGYEDIYIWSVNFSSWIFGSLSFVILYINLNKLFSKNISLITSLGMYLATPWIYYQLFEPSMSHMASLLMVNLFLYLVIRMYSKKSVNMWLLFVVIFLMLAVRWQNLLFLLAYIPVIYIYRNNFYKIIKYILPAVVASFMFWASQFLIWHHLYGSYVLLPQGQGFVRSEFHGLYILFSSNRGLLLWSPIIIFSCLGFYYLWLRSKVLFCITLLTIGGQWLINGLLSDLGGGDAYGARRFIETLPFFGILLASFISNLKNRRIIYFVITILLIINILLIQAYRYGYLPRGGEFNIWSIVDINNKLYNNQ